MAGYSKTPLWKKLGYKPGMPAMLHDAPANYRKLLNLPASVAVEWRDAISRELKLVHIFTKHQAELESVLKHLRSNIASEGVVWVSWPKKAAKIETDITEDRVREAALPMGFVDIKVCAIDSVWSGLKLVIRKQLR